MQRIIATNKQKMPKVFVGLSGGVDSSVAAALLKHPPLLKGYAEAKQGYDVIGVFIKIWDEKWGNCQWPEERRDAMKVAIKLGIPFKTLDLSAEYKKEVVNYMIREYKLGRTPNPDVMCNKTIKFGAFLKWALKNGADYVATGHYARRWEFSIFNFQFSIKPQIPKKSKIINHKSKIQLLRGVDETKDQSYFLWQLKQAQLKHCLFPIGDYKKSEVRELAKKFGLPTAEKPDSQGICFVGKVGLKEFLQQYLKPKRGKVLNEKKEVIGYHDGAFFLTIGQRHGFVVTKKTPNDAPFYIVEKDIKRNTITVSQKSEQQIVNSKKNKSIIIHKINWINGEPEKNKNYQARFRHLQELKVCKVIKLKVGEYKIKFNEPQDGAASGQSLVLYDNDICIGGGIIKSNGR
ncbi:MAG: tRNA 2-thiouridine(34) synthase MnmA [Patescibacteria group bacterium]